MPQVKSSSLRDLSAEEIHGRVAELREELFNLRFQQATRQLTNTDRLRQVRKDIARVLTRRTELQGEEAAR